MGRHGERKKAKTRGKAKQAASKSSSSSEEEWVEVEDLRNKSEGKKLEPTFISEGSQKRENWMDLPTSFTSISNIDRQKQRNQEKKNQEGLKQYDPSKSSRELNPYWKHGGDGLPKFKKPKEDEGNLVHTRNELRRTSNWKKTNVSKSEIKANEYSNPTCSKSDLGNNDITSETELNLLAGKLVKAEIMGNITLVAELTAKLDKARKAIELAKSEEKYEGVLLTKTDSQGRSQPLKFKSDLKNSSVKHKKRKIETHKNNERVKYFADDDNYSLKEMFEEEKYNMPNDHNKDFVEIYSKVRKNDDLDNLFVDTIRRKKSDLKSDAANNSRAIIEHQKMETKLDNCTLCIQSKQSQNHLIVSMGEYAYLSLPAYEPLTTGHCFLVPIRHVSCSTHADENEWAELMNFRKALVRYFETKNKKTVFFECSMMFHKHPHMVIECIPISKEHADMAPMYFKKAIDESETDWAQNKKLVSLKGRDVRKAIPKGLPYFFVSFGLEEGYAHVIEDERIFPKNFAQEIIGGMLDLHHSKWLKPKRQMFKDQSDRVVQFSNEWKEFDCTKN
ncbi:CWF19-like protein 2 homolog [Cylas formicarius]|uniref:CWF19-like protein 2 homolog n=1 Tax=Cylas formicarius TaxID=197179 RepID=UPI002958A813|nr:CWF19-like protein 2 homolog [Cylas formicarius]